MTIGKQFFRPAEQNRLQKYESNCSAELPKAARLMCNFFSFCDIKALCEWLRNICGFCA